MRDCGSKPADMQRILPQPQRDQMVNMLNQVAALMSQISDELFRTLERRNAVGKGFRNFGFMIGANNSANNNPQFVPPFLNVPVYNEIVDDFQFMRDVVERMNSITKDAIDSMNVLGNEGFNLSLAYYAAVREVAHRTHDKQAMSVFQYLRSFFRRGKIAMNQPTEAQVERDIKALLHGTKDGEVIVRNERPHISGGTHEVIDETHSGHAAVKATVNENLKQ